MQTILESEPEYSDVKQSELTWLGQRDYDVTMATRREDLLDLCEVLNIEVSSARRAKINQMELADLQRVWAHIKQHRSWPAE